MLFSASSCSDTASKTLTYLSCCTIEGNDTVNFSMSFFWIFGKPDPILSAITSDCFAFKK